MELAVVVIHGLGSQRPGFEEQLIEAVSRRLRTAGHDPDQVAWQPIYWADILEGRQQGYLDRAEDEHNLRWDWLRKHVVRGLGDAAAYQFVDQPNPAYGKIHDRIRECIQQLYEDKLGERPVPLVVLAHSLGSHIMSSYIWDTQHGTSTGAAPGSSAFEKMGWLAGMITFGSTIPLFTFAYDPVEPIAFPGDRLPAEQRQKAQWLNYYDADDVLGYPLKPTSRQYDRVVLNDIEINVGSLLESWNPASHNGYWNDRSFTDPVADQLAAFL